MDKRDDWRLTNQIGFLYNATLREQRWDVLPKVRDHDHCAFCWARFADAGIPEALQIGFATPDRYHWVCKSCLADFREQFAWTVIEDSSLRPN